MTDAAAGFDARPAETTGRRFLWAAIGASLIVVVTYIALILTPFGQELENLALRGAREVVPEIRQSSLTDLHEISMLSFAVAIAVVTAIALLRRKPTLALAAGAVMVCSVVIAEIAKRVLVRPELVEAPHGWLNNSFPSGHVTIAVAIGIGAVLVLPYALRWLGIVGGALFAIGIGQAVETAGWHRLSGVIGATFLVIVVASIVVYLLARSGRVQPFPARRLIGALIATGILGAIALFFGVAGLGFGLSRLLPVPEIPSEADWLLAYTSTLLAGSAVIAVAFLGFLWLIRPFAIDEPPTPQAPDVT